MICIFRTRWGSPVGLGGRLPGRHCTEQKKRCAAQAATVAERVVKSMHESGVKTVFGIPGTHIVPIYHALEKYASKLPHVTMKHEQGVGFAAEGHARATGELAAAVVITGVGLTNVLSPMAAAMADSTPMIVVSGEVPHMWQEKPKRQYSHFVPDAGRKLAAAVSKRSFEVGHPDEVERTIREACELATSGRPGPVHVSIPIDLLRAPCGGGAALEAAAAPAPAARLAPSESLALARAASALAKRERPLIIAGGGAMNYGAQVRELAERLGAPVLSTVAGKGVLDERHGLAVGGRLHTPQGRDYLVSRADSLILLGTQLSPTDFWQFKHHEEVPLQLDRLGPFTLHVDIDAEGLEQGGVAQAGGTTVLADVGLACEHLVSALSELEAASPSWAGKPEAAVALAKKLADSKQAMSQAMLWDFSAGSGGEEMRKVLRALREALPEGSPMVADVCRIAYSSLSLYPAYSPRSFLYPVGTTCLGYAVPAAIGAAIAKPGTPIAAIVGDGGFQFTMSELAVAAELQLPILLVLWNDASFGEIRRNVGSFATTWPTPDFASICAAYGVPHTKTSDAAGIAEAVKSAAFERWLQGKGGPMMLEVERLWDKQAATLPKPILGTMTFGWDKTSSVVGDDAAADILKSFLAAGGEEIDTARSYCSGATEEILARAIKGLPSELQGAALVATKANPAGDHGDAAAEAGHFRAPLIDGQLRDSLRALSADAVDVFYLHWPDRDTPLDETLAQVQRMYLEGRFARLGLSNFAAWEVRKVHEHMRDRGWVLPSVYQGMYNAVTRDIEGELFPTLRELGMSFYAYNPLAGGLLTGKHCFSEGPRAGRFSENEFYQKRYWKQGYFEALASVQEACAAAAIPMAEAAIRWMTHHSQLDGGHGDGIVLGCSSTEQLESNLRSMKCEEPLPERVIAAWNDAWECAKPSCPRYDPYGHSGQGSAKGSAEPAMPGGHSARVITSADIDNGGKQVVLTFDNGDKYTFHSAWLKDSAADNFGSSYNRKSADHFRESLGSIATRASTADSGSSLCVHFEAGGREHLHIYDSRWLHAFAPYVARMPASSRTSKAVEGHGALLSDLTLEAHKTPVGHWRSEKKIKGFDCQQMINDSKEQLRFLEVMAAEGVAMIYDLPAPSDLGTDTIGENLEHFVSKVVGRMYTPPRRNTNYGVMRKNMAAMNIGKETALADYNFSNPLSMHTDHAIYHETPGYLQFNWQAQASVRSKVCNGISVAEHLRATDPKAFDLLSSVYITHAVRTNHYTTDGAYANAPSTDHEGTFEQAHTHRVIELDEEKNVTKVIHNELKRGTSAIPYEQFEDFSRAYAKWIRLCEDPRFVCEFDWPEHSAVVVNNHFVLHGRAWPMPGAAERERIMVWGYTRKDIAENRYRLLKQRELKNSGLSDDLTRNIPNQVLRSLYGCSGSPKPVKHANSERSVASPILPNPLPPLTQANWQRELRTPWARALAE